MVGDNHTAIQLLQNLFGYTAFRSPQDKVIDALVSGDHSLVLMPTGGGKSLCYQIPALLRNGVGVVVSPLIALMQDQVTALQQVGVTAVCLNSRNSSQENYEIEQGLRQGVIDIVYIAPERLLMSRTLHLLQSINISLFAIDEAHCISQWGHDFRAEYQQLTQLSNLFPNVPRIALTATADELTRKDIIQCLALENASVYIGNFDRPNIHYWVNESSGRDRERLVDFIDARHNGESGIIYCLSRNRVDKLAEWLATRGYKAVPYHAGLSHNTREANQNRFINEEGIIVVATIAFGMGIDKPNVRFVAHMNLPKNLEAYYQETGRAGRDGAPADAWMVYGLQDVAMLRSMLESLGEGSEQHRVESHKLRSMVGFCEVTTCRRQVLLEYFGQALEKPCGNCDVCINPPETWDGTVAAQKALSCVYRTEQRFGVYHNIDILIGKKTDKVQQFRHDRLSTFGVGHDLSIPQWRSVFQQLIAVGFLTVDIEQYGAVKLTERARSVLKGQEEVRFRKTTKATGLKERKAKPRSRQATVVTLEPDGQQLFEELKLQRLNIAKEQNVPPYIIFHDATLIAMAERKPLTEGELMQISGVGELKLKKYGQAFLDVILEIEEALSFSQ